MFCRNCGKPMEGEELLCPECAAKQAAEQAPVAEAPAFTVASVDQTPPKKKKKLGLVLGIVLAIILALGIACFAFWGKISALFNPAEPPAGSADGNVEPQTTGINVDAVADALADSYEKLLNAELTTSTGGKFSTEIIIGDAVITALEPYIPEELGDVEWLSHLKLDVDYAVTDSAMRYSVGLGLKKGRLLTVEAVLEMESGTVYLTIPELNATPVRGQIDMADLEEALTSSQASQLMAEAILESLPSKETFHKLVTDYLTLVVDNLPAAQAAQSQIAIGDLSQAVTANTISFHEKDALNIAEAVLTKAKDDEAIIGLLENLAENLAEAMPDADISFDADEFTAGIKYTLAEIQEGKEYTDDSYFYLFTTYVDAQNRTAGYKLALSEDGVGTELFHAYKLYSSDNDYVFELYLPNTMGEDICLKGSGNKSSITCTFVISEVPYATVTVNNQNDTTGSIRIAPEKDLIDMLADSSDVSVPTSILSTFALELRYSGNDCTLAIMAGEDDMLAIKLAVDESNGKVTIPNDSVAWDDPEALMIWASDIDFEAFLEHLEDAGVPKTVIDLLTDYLESALTESM